MNFGSDSKRETAQYRPAVPAPTMATFIYLSFQPPAFNQLL